MANLKDGTTIGNYLALHTGNYADFVASSSHNHDSTYLGISATAAQASKVIVSDHTSNNIEYPLVWHNNSNTLYDTVSKMTFNPSLGRITATTFSGGNVTSGSDPGHTHTTYASTSHNHDSTYLGITAKAADSEKVDGINGASLMRSDATDYQSNTWYIRGNIVVETGYRHRGMFGTYDSSKTQHIWSMGTGYINNSVGSNFGNLYGAAYKHTNNTTGGNMAGGHQMVWCQNGNGTAAIGSGVWTSGTVYESSQALSSRYAALSHSHSGYATTSHSHSNYKTFYSLTSGGLQQVDLDLYLGVVASGSYYELHIKISGSGYSGSGSVALTSLGVAPATYPHGSVKYIPTSGGGSNNSEFIVDTGGYVHWDTFGDLLLPGIHILYYPQPN